MTFVSSLQTIGSEENQGLADFGVIQYYGWRKVTIFQLDVDSFENVRISILGIFNKKKICVIQHCAPSPHAHNNTMANVFFFVQVTIVLEERLKELKVDVTVKTFEEDEGIAGLGDDPFVSCTVVHVVRTCNVSNTLKHSCL